MAIDRLLPAGASKVRAALSRLKASAPDLKADLRGPASPASLAKFDAWFAARQLEVPRLLRYLYSLHDGTRPYKPFWDSEWLLSIDQAIETSAMVLESTEGMSGPKDSVDERIESDRWYRNRWWRLTDQEGDGWLIDFDPAPSGRVGQMFRFTTWGGRPRKVEAKSLAEWCTRILPEGV